MFFFALFLVGSFVSLASEGFGAFIFAIGYLASFAVGIYLVKLGIDKARDFAKFELRELGQETDIRTNKDQVSSEYQTSNYQDSDRLIKDRSESTVEFLSNRAKNILDSIPKIKGPRSNLSKTEAELAELKSLYDRELISKEEYQSMRKKTLGL